MTPIAARLVRLSFIYLVLGSTIGAAALVSKATGIWLWAIALRPLHGEMLLYGWFVHIIMGVATWILPRPQRQKPAALLTSAAVVLNAGIFVASAGRLAAVPEIHLAGRAFIAGAILLFALYIWPRVNYALRRA